MTIDFAFLLAAVAVVVASFVARRIRSRSKTQHVDKNAIGVDFDRYKHKEFSDRGVRDQLQR